MGKEFDLDISKRLFSIIANLEILRQFLLI